MIARLFASVVGTRGFALAKTLCLLLVLTAFAMPAYADGGPPNVPEIDPSTAASALTLLAGGMLMLTGGRRRK